MRKLNDKLSSHGAAKIFAVSMREKELRQYQDC